MKRIILILLGTFLILIVKNNEATSKKFKHKKRQKLKETGLSKNTVIIFTSDNGFSVVPGS